MSVLLTFKNHAQVESWEGLVGVFLVAAGFEWENLLLGCFLHTVTVI